MIFLEKHRTLAITASWAIVLLVAALIFSMSAKDGATLDHGSGLVSTIKAWLASTGQALFGHPVDVSPVGHFSEYFVFGAALFNALQWHLSQKKSLLAAPLIASLYGITDEIHQIFVPTRSCDPADWAVDTVAAIVGAILAYAVIKRLKKTKGAGTTPTP